MPKSQNLPRKKPTAAQDAGASGTGEGGSNWLSRWRQKQDIRQSYYAAAHSGTAAQTAGGKAASNGTTAAKSGMEQVIDKGKSVVSTAVNGIANFAKSNAHVLLIVGVFLCSCCWSCRHFRPVPFCFPAPRRYPGRPFIPQRTGTSGEPKPTTRSWKRSWTKNQAHPHRPPRLQRVPVSP